VLGAAPIPNRTASASRTVPSVRTTCLATPFYDLISLIPTPRLNLMPLSL